MIIADLEAPRRGPATLHDLMSTSTHAGVLMLRSLLTGLALLVSVSTLRAGEPDRLLPTDYAAARKSFTTTLAHKGPSPQEADPLPKQLPAGVKEVTFKSGDLELKAWLKDQNNGQKHPAIVFCHGGFAFGAGDFEDAAKFADAGFVVLAPILRGENGQPGSFELFLGEVDDVIAAGKFAATLPSVDPKRVFVSGHSAGATVALFSVLTSDTPYAAAAPIGPAMDMLDIARPEFQGLFVFDPLTPREMLIRSPVYFAASLKRPAFIVAGDKDLAARLQAHQFVANATAAGARCEVHTVTGDHFTSVEPAIKTIIPLLRDLPSPAK